MSSKQRLSVHLEFDRLDSSPQPAAYLEVGTGTPLLMLHGFLGDGQCWLPLMERLQSQFRCVALDLLGFGDSAKPSIQYNVAKEVAFVDQVIQKLQLAPCYILGHSFGGWVAAAYALQYTDAVKGIFLAAPAGVRDDSFAGRYDHLRPLLWQTPIVDWALTLLKPISIPFGQRPTLDQLSWFRQELNAQPAARSFLLDRLRPEDAIDTVEKEIHRLRVPTLVITGDRDETIPLWHCETYAQEIPNAQMVVIPDADHALPQKYAPELAEAIVQFLENSLTV
ncbi:alpha/beta fold hydrolase [Phormidesmis priestleyi]